MAQAKHDNNSIRTILGTLNTDGETPTLVKADPTSHALKADDNTTGTDFGDDIASRDDNRIPVMMAVSSADGVTPVAIYANSSGELLIDST